MTVAPSTVAVSADTLLEATAHLFALGDIERSLHGACDTGLSERYGELASELALLLYDHPDGDEEFATHPVSVAVESRAAELAGEFLAGIANTAWLAQRAVAYVQHAREMRSCGSISVGFPEIERSELDDLLRRAEALLPRVEALERSHPAPRPPLAVLPGGES